jgi:hypothetical protein
MTLKMFEAKSRARRGHWGLSKSILIFVRLARSPRVDARHNQMTGHKRFVSSKLLDWLVTDGLNREIWLDFGCELYHPR